MAMLVKDFAGKRKAIDETNKRIEVLVSDDSIDHDGDIIALDAWDKRLPEYMKNPIFCWGHPLGDKNAGPDRLLGRTVEAVRGPEGLTCLFEYAVDLNPLSRMCWEMAAADILKSYSVAGEPYSQVSWWDGEESIDSLDPKYAAALKAGHAGLVVTDIELWEVSQVLKGSNRNALMRAVADGVIQKSALGALRGERPALIVPVGADLRVKTAPSEPVPESPQEAPNPNPQPALSEDEELAAALAADPEAAEALVDLLDELI